jgi:hypothetical protein
LPSAVLDSSQNRILIPHSVGKEDNQSQSDSRGAKGKEEGEKGELEKGG